MEVFNFKKHLETVVKRLRFKRLFSFVFKTWFFNEIIKETKDLAKIIEEKCACEFKTKFITLPDGTVHVKFEVIDQHYFGKYFSILLEANLYWVFPSEAKWVYNIKKPSDNDILYNSFLMMLKYFLKTESNPKWKKLNLDAF